MTQAEALSVLTTGVNVFLTGEPGSGKTHTVNRYIEWLRARGIEPAITASTGIAATHLHGMTIHSWSGIGIRDQLSEADVDAIAQKEHVARRILKTSVLIIDEVSMLSAQVLTSVDAVLRAVRQSDRPFGGLQVVLVGDFFQLPPVSRTRDAQFSFESPAWEKLNPIICYLDEQHRQGAGALLEVLSAIRSGEWDQTHVSAILSRETEAEGFEEDVPWLYAHNADIDRVNADRLRTLKGQGMTYRMHGTGAPLLVESLKRGCLSPEVLELKEGAVVMGTKNVPASGLVNGMLGVVTGFAAGSRSPIVEFRSGEEMAIEPADWAVEEGGTVRAKVTQIPLRLAWAMTIHKSQGMSMDAAAIDLSRTFEYGQGYVALSRVRSLEGLYLLGWNEGAFALHPRVEAQEKGFRELSKQAVRSFEALEASGEHETMVRAFIKGAGGSFEPEEGDGVKKAAKRSRAGGTTYDETLRLLEEGQSATAIAQVRSLTLGTIADHLEKLTGAGKITRERLMTAIPEPIHTAYPAIAVAFDTHGADKLTPVFKALNGMQSYDEIKLARLLYLSKQD